MRAKRICPYLAIGMFFLISDFAAAQTTATIGTGTSSSSTRGPFQRADTNSSTVYSRWIMTYTSGELSTAGIPNGASISELKWESGSSNTIIGSGNADLKIYIKNSSATKAATGSWSTLISGATKAVDTSFNTTNNFPGAKGWMPFTFDAPFKYTGGALEIAVDWDCSKVSTPAFSGDGAIKWRWESTAPDTLVAKKTSSSSASSTISDLKNERANIQIVYNAVTCDKPTSLYAMTTSGSATFNWVGSSSATSYDWKIVPSGMGSSSAAVDSGNTMNLNDSSTALSALTSYDLFVKTDCGSNGSSAYAGPYRFSTRPLAQSTLTFGASSSSSSTRGPFQRSDTNSSTVYTRWNHVYTASELSAQGLTNGSLITALNWELASSNVVIGSGNATLKVYIRNSSVTAATSDTWTNLTSGSSLVVDRAFNTTNNFPGANGWMPFSFNKAFTYTGGALEIAVDWDCSQVSTPAFSGDGALKWRWTSTAPDDLVVKKTSSSGPSSTVSDLKDERANMQIVYAVTSCDAPTNLGVSNVDSNTTSLSWSPSIASLTYSWRIVPDGAGAMANAIDSGMVSDTTDMASGLTPGTSYDIYVMSDCGGIGTSSMAGPFSFTTLCGATPATTIATVVSNVSCNGGNDGSIDLTVTAGVAPYDFLWSNSEITEDISSLMAGKYKLTVTDGNGCPYYDSVSVTEPSPLALVATSAPDTSSAGVGSASVDVTGGTAPYNYTWNGVPGDSDSTMLLTGTYKVVVEDANGCEDSVSFMVDVITGLAYINEIVNLTIAPNPTSGAVNVAVQLTEVASVSVSVYNITGELVKEVFTGDVKTLSYPVEFSSFENGLYFVNVSVNGQATMKKVLLTK